MAKILVFGEYPPLIRVRSMALRDLGHDVHDTDQLNQVLAKGDQFELTVVCSSVSPETRRSLEQHVEHGLAAHLFVVDAQEPPGEWLQRVEAALH